MKWLNLEDYLKHPGAPDTVGPSLITACGPYVMVERGLEQFYQVGGGKDFFPPNPSLFRNKKKENVIKLFFGQKWAEPSFSLFQNFTKITKSAAAREGEIRGKGVWPYWAGIKSETRRFARQNTIRFLEIEGKWPLCRSAEISLRQDTQTPKQFNFDFYWKRRSS